MSKLRKLLISSLAIILVFSIFAYPSVGYAAEETTTAPTITYITGATKLKEAIAISQKIWVQSESVIITSGVNFPDALAGTPLAMINDSPILYTASIQSLDVNNDSSNWNEIVRLGAKKVYILGGIGVVSQGIENKLKSNGLEVIRFSNSDRFGTAKAIGDEIVKTKNTNTVFLANAFNFPDAIAVSTFAGQIGCPIVLTDKTNLNVITKNAIKEWNVKTVYIVGGTGVISQGIEDSLKNQGINVIRLGGQNRYETAQKIIKNFKTNITSMTLTTGTDFHSALAGSVYGYKTNHPVMLFDKNVDKSIKEFVWACSDLVIIGTGFSEADIQPTSTPVTDTREAGVFTTDTSKLVTVNKSLSYDTNLYNLNHMIGPTYGLSYMPTMTKSGTDSGVATFKYNKTTNSYGLSVFGWRQSYDSNIAENDSINAVLETLYFLSGDKKVASSLWNWLDSTSINGECDSSKFGFTDVKSTSNGGTIKMNGIEIDVTISSGTMTFYFK